MHRIIFHIDMDAFYASVEQRCNPNLLGKPVIVGGSIGTRGVVSTCSYEARQFGVRSAMPIAKARRLCPNGIYLDVDPEKYASHSREIFRLFRTFTPVVEPWSIDEAFLDMTATAERFGGPLAAGEKIRAHVRAKTDLPATIGIAPNKLLAKLVSGHAKPDGLRRLLPEDVKSYIEELPVRDLWGIGEKTERALLGLGIRTLGELGRAARPQLGRRMGVVGQRLVMMGMGRDDTPVTPYFASEAPRSMGHERTMGSDLHDWDAIERVLLSLSDKVARRLRVEGYKGRTIVAKIRFASFRTITRNKTLPIPTDEDGILFNTARALVRDAIGSPPRESIRLLGVSLTGLVSAAEAGLLPLLEEDGRDRRRIDALDAVRDRFGDAALIRARLL